MTSVRHPMTAGPYAMTTGPHVMTAACHERRGGGEAPLSSQKKRRVRDSQPTPQVLRFDAKQSRARRSRYGNIKPAL